MKAVDSRILRAVRAERGNPEPVQRIPSRRCIQLTLVVISIILLLLLLNYLRTFDEIAVPMPVSREPRERSSNEMSNLQQAPSETSEPAPVHLETVDKNKLDVEVNENSSESGSNESVRQLRTVKIQANTKRGGLHRRPSPPTNRSNSAITQRILARDRAVELTNLSAAHKTIHVFVHIPKSGGQSFFDVINREYDRAGYTNASNLFLFPETGFSHASHGCVDPSKRVAGTHCGVSEIHDCITSNRAIRNHQRIIYDHESTKLKFITILRNPVKRVVSEYFYWKPCKSNSLIPWGEQLCQDANSFESWLGSPSNVVHNRMVKQLVMLPRMSEKRVVPAHCTTFHFANVHEYFRNYYNISKDAKNPRRVIAAVENRINEDKSLLQNAKRVLREEFFFVGFQDRMENSTVELLSALQINKTAIRLPHIHSTGVMPRIDEKSAAAIRRKNELDVALYRWATSYFSSGTPSGINRRR